MKRTATVTFHASHNYGSMLQAYALQQIIKGLGFKNKIINLRTERQKDLYTVFTKRVGFKYILKNLSHLFYYYPLRRRYIKFESFLTDYLDLTEEYTSLEQIEKAKTDYDIYIAGSDQIWNPVPADFDWAYYLEFVNKGKKISYAPSFGQLASLGGEDTQKRIAKDLKSFESITVREQRAAENVKKLSGKDAEIVVDPTLLLPKEKWLSLIVDRNKKKEDYIFFYTLFADSHRIKLVKEISKLTGLPVITSNFSNQYDVINPFIKAYDAGPIDFLHLIRDAKLSICSSFHGTVFSCIFNTPFFAIDGMDDARISTLLSSLGLEHRSVDKANISERVKMAMDTSDFVQANELLAKNRIRSLDILRRMLEE